MDNQKFYYYFIENHIIDENIKIKIKNSNNKLELIRNFEKENEKENKKFLISLYRIEATNNEITLELDYKKDNKFEGKISVINMNRDYFIFNFKFNKKISKNPKTPKSMELNRRAEFDLYYEALMFLYTGYKNYQDKFNVIYAILSLLIDYDDKLEFSIYLKIFKETIPFSLVNIFIHYFEFNKLQGIGRLEEEKIKEISNNIEIIYNIIIGNDAQMTEHNLIKLFTFILYFNYVYNVRKISELLNNETINIYCYKGLIQYSYLFNMTLEKKHISYLINTSTNFSELIQSLNYCNDINYLMDIILENFSRFIDLYEDNTEKIDICKICNPKSNDNVKKIFESYSTLYILQKDNDKKFFIDYNSSFADKYINMGLKYEELMSIKKMLYEIVKINKNIDNLFHKNGLVLIINKKLKNMEIIKYFKLNNFYKIYDFSYQKYHSLLILNGLDVTTFDEQFYLEWKKIKWKDVFEKKYEEFIQKILGLVNDMQYFNVLFKLLDESENTYNYKFDSNSLNGMSYKFLNIMDTNKPKDFTNYINDIVLLIVYLDRKLDMNYFLARLRGIIETEILLQIYLNIIINYKNTITSATNTIITDYFSAHLDEINPNIYFGLILHCPKFSKQLLKSINKYTLQRKDIFQKEESENLKFFKLLLDRNEIDKDEYKRTNYLIESLSLIYEIKANIEENEISYNDIYSFYSKNTEKMENEDLLISRLKIIFLNDKKETEKYKDIIDRHYYEIKNILDELELILNDFKEFYPIKERENIKSLEDMINNMKNCYLKSYKEKYSEKYNKYISFYKKGTEERNLRKKSLFFNTIYKTKKLFYENDNNRCINETIKSFNSLKYIFNKEEINYIDKGMLKICLSEIKDMKKEDIIKEINILKDIFKKEINNIDYDDEELSNIFIYIINSLILKDDLNKKKIIFEKIKLDDIIVPATKTRKNTTLEKIKLDDIVIPANKIKTKIEEDSEEEKNKKIFEFEKLNKELMEKINKLQNKNKILEEKINKELMEQINKLKNEIKNEQDKNKILDEKIKELNTLLNNEKNKNNVMGGVDNKDQDKVKVMQLMEEIMEKDKELRDIKIRRPIELLPGEKLMTVIFTSHDQKMMFSLICKNTDKFSQLEQNLFEKHKDFMDYMDSGNCFLYKGQKEGIKRIFVS